MKPLSERLTDLEQIQVGDITRVYRARDIVLDRFVFVKILQPKFAVDTELRGRFLREAKAVARLDHENLVRIYESGEDPAEGFYMILEWVDGITLAEELKERQRLKSREFHQLAKELLSGLGALHSVGILHRDLKPENVLVKKTKASAASELHYKITDFSLAALRDAPRLTHHQSIIGTPAYMSPEHASGAALCEASDLFSLGVILYEAATGKNPFLGSTLLETLKNIREQEITLNAAEYPDLQEHHRILILMLLSKDTARRPASANETLSLLDSPREIVIQTTEQRRKNFRVVPLLAVMIVTVVAIVLFMPESLTIHPPPEGILDSAKAQQDLYEKAETVLNGELKSLSPNVEQTKPSDDSSAKTTKAKAAPQNDTAKILMRETTASADSVEFFLTTEPWAHVYFEGKQIGTTPLSAPLKLPAGRQSLDLQNPAYPQVEVQLVLNEKSLKQQINLGDYVALVRVKVKPWGEFYLDGEHIGTTPLTKPLFVAPGKHSVRISHPDMTSVTRELTTTAGETLSVEVDLMQSKIIVQ